MIIIHFYKHNVLNHRSVPFRIPYFFSKWILNDLDKSEVSIWILKDNEQIGNP